MYGVYNTVSKEFQFGIRGETKEEVMKKLVDKIGKDAQKWRFEVKELPSSKKPKRIVKE